MIRILVQRRWLAALAAATAFFVLCLFLGRWQWGRHVERLAFADAVHRNYAAAPVSLEQALPPDGPLPEDRQWTRVRVSGAYDEAGTQFVRNRPQNVTYGYEVLVPLRLPDGGALMVDRGWVKNSERADVLPRVPGPPPGRVTVTGWLRPGESSLGRDLPAGQMASIDLEEAATRTGLPVRQGAYLILQEEDAGTASPPPRPAALLPPDTDTGPHFAYALQWWAGSIVGFVIVFVYARREQHDALVAAGHVREEPRPKKHRIWDDEDE